jgi:hypothetical protein
MYRKKAQQWSQATSWALELHHLKGVNRLIVLSDTSLSSPFILQMEHTMNSPTATDDAAVSEPFP